MNLTEEWRPVVGFVGYYEVSNLGNVRSISRKVREKSPKGGYFQEGRIVAKVLNKQGYLTVNLCRDEICITKTIHRLVAQAFLPNPDNLPQVNHKDEVKTNNRLDNLEWCTAKYNVNYGTGIQRMQEGTRKPIYQLDKETKEIVKVWKWVGEVAKEYGCGSGRVFGWCQDYAEAEGYIWCYAEDYKEGYWSGKTIKTIRSKSRKVYKIDPTTLKVLSEYATTDELRKDGFETTAVYNACEGKTRKHGGYFWSYDPDTFRPKKMNHPKRKVIQFDLQTGEELGRWESLRDMTKETGYLGPHVGSCCRGLRGDAYGYGWKYTD